MATKKKTEADKKAVREDRKQEVEEAEGKYDDRVGESYMYDLNVTAEERGYGDQETLAPENELQDQVKDYDGTVADVDPDDNIANVKSDNDDSDDDEDDK